MLQFFLLGPLEIQQDGRALRIGSPKQRTLLIRLLLEEGRFVSADRLTDDLWRGTPPAGATGTLRSYVSHVRRALGTDAGVLRSAGGRGYALDAPAESVDTRRFELAAAAGQRRLAAGEPAAAVRELDRALSMWRGGALSDVIDEEFARAAIARLDELRTSVREDRLDALVQLGSNDAAIAELGALVAEHPLRERPHSLLMRALYRVGRTAEALGVFDRFRARMVEDLGLDPSSDLVLLRDEILRQDPTLLEGSAARSVVGATAAVEPTPRTSPVALPVLLQSFVGRDAEMERLAGLLERTRLVSLVGPGGAGKTTLAVAAGHAASGAFPDGRWFVPLASEDDPDRVPRAVAGTLGVAGEGPPTDRLAAQLDNRSALLVLDNCEHLADACARFVEELLQRTTGLHILATTREPLGVAGEIQMTVPPLAREAAVSLFIDRARAANQELDLEPDRETIATVCDRLDGLPLAVELAAARVRSITPREILARLDDRFTLLTGGRRTAEDRHRTLRAVIDWSHDLLSGDEGTLFRRLAVFGGGWTLEAAEEICDLEGDGNVLDVLDRLVERSLVVSRDGRFGMLETIHAYASERLSRAPDPEVALLGRRHASYFAGLARSLEPQLRGGAQDRALGALRDEDQNLRRALRWSREHGRDDPDAGLDLCASLGWYWYVGRQVDGRTELPALLAASPGATDLVRARALRSLSLSLRPGGCIVHPDATAAAAAAEAAELFTGVGGRSEAALCELMAAVEGVTASEPEDHLGAVAAARSDLRELGDAWGLALADFVEMEIRLHHGETDPALRLGRRAAAAFDALHDAWGRSAVRLHLGIGLRLAGELTGAAAALTDAVAISRVAGLDNNLARALLEVARLAIARGQPAAAERDLDEAGRMIDRLADPLLRTLVRTCRGEAARLRGEPAEAREHYLAAVGIATSAGLRGEVARSLLGAAATAMDLGLPERAAVELRRAAEIADDLDDAGLHAATAEQRARLRVAEGDAGGAAALLEVAESIRDAGSRPRTALEDRDVDATRHGQTTASTT